MLQSFLWLSCNHAEETECVQGDVLYCEVMQLDVNERLTLLVSFLVAVDSSVVVIILINVLRDTVNYCVLHRGEVCNEKSINIAAMIAAR